MRRLVLLLLLFLYGCSSGGNSLTSSTTSSAQAGTALRAVSLVLQVNGQAFPSGVLMYRNSVVQVSGLVRMSDGTMNARIAFDSSDPAIASVDSNGYLIAKRTGQVTLRATSQDDPSKKVTITVQVESVTGPDSLAIIQASKPISDITSGGSTGTVTTGGSTASSGSSPGGSSAPVPASMPAPTSSPRY